jgi:hypothetical protein
VLKRPPSLTCPQRSGKGIPGGRRGENVSAGKAEDKDKTGEKSGKNIRESPGEERRERGGGKRRREKSQLGGVLRENEKFRGSHGGRDYTQNNRLYRCFF